ncbi:FBLN1 protein, partial [Polypterus senegalus]
MCNQLQYLSGSKLSGGIPSLPQYSKVYCAVVGCFKISTTVTWWSDVSGSRRLQHEKVESIRCIKSCQPHDISCIMNNVHTISYTVISLPTYRDFFRPEEIIFLRLSPSHLPMPSEIVFNIVEGDEGNFFDVIKRVENNIIMGVVRQVKQIVGPAEIVLKLATNFTDRGIVSHRNIVNVHIFVSEHWF